MILFLIPLVVYNNIGKNGTIYIHSVATRFVYTKSKWLCNQPRKLELLMLNP